MSQVRDRLWHSTSLTVLNRSDDQAAAITGRVGQGLAVGRPLGIVRSVVESLREAHGRRDEFSRSEIQWGDLYVTAVNLGHDVERRQCGHAQRQVLAHVRLDQFGRAPYSSRREPKCRTWPKRAQCTQRR